MSRKKVGRAHRLNQTTLKKLASEGVCLIAWRCAGFNKAAADLGLTVVRVPAYSPNAVAEHALRCSM